MMLELKHWIEKNAATVFRVDMLMNNAFLGFRGELFRRKAVLIGTPGEVFKLFGKEIL